MSLAETCINEPDNHLFVTLPILCALVASGIKLELTTFIEAVWIWPSPWTCKLPQDLAIVPKAYVPPVSGVKLEDIVDPVDIVNVFRPSKEAPVFAQQAVKINTKVFWLQYGIENEEAKKIVESKNIVYVSNKCIKQEYQRLFLKVSPVFPALKK